MLRQLIATVLMICFAIAAGAETRMVNSPGDGYLNLRTGPGSEYQIVQRMGHGSRVDVLETKGSWSRVRQQANGAEGWAFRKYLVPEKARSVKRTVYSPGDGFLNMRTGPGSEFKIMRRMYHGDQVDILERKGSWVRVYHPRTGAKGWAFEKYLRK
ncbi:SH3 domain-containing protein [Rhodobacteraceae bacterium LMO-12]|nr:SH3 domain-containing protein [Rhodobacteraceae bacterium LMO-JJ12]